ncbi:phospholipase D family protein [Amnibacterium sp.]|uniref:phospholipase D family protein n=1 Tax=Amnibacterium sp. TaxID=1872496 RepID=UPI003F7BE9FF
MVGASTDWFLDGAESRVPGASAAEHREGPWSEGNLVRPLVHGAVYFARLHAELDALRPGDRVWFTDWRGDADERLLPDGPTIGELLCDLAERGVEVRGLVWRSHGERLAAPVSGRANSKLGRRINDAGGEVLLDQRVRRFGSHHQKLVVVRRRGDPERDVAFVGGIDLCHSRRDDEHHAGDPQALAMDPRYGPRPPWHDAALELRGPVVVDVLRLFAERWDDPTPLDAKTPYRMLLQRLARMPRHPRPLPETAPPPAPAGPHAVQLLRTYGRKRPPFPFAPDGERTIARAYEKAFARATRLIYIEDQYLWSTEVVRGIVRSLAAHPRLRVVVVVPRHPDSSGAVVGPALRLGQIRAIRALRRAAPDRVGVFDIENAAGTPVYVHAKICIIDDVWFTCGSDNFNRRSWTTDSELTCAVVGGDRDGTLASSLRRGLWSEHLGLPAHDPRLDDLDGALALWRTLAQEVERWGGPADGPHPAARVRAHRPEPVTRLQRLWAEPIYRTIADPDGRPARLRGTDRF